MKEAQAWEPESPKFKTKLHHLLCIIYLTNLSLGFLYLQNKDNKTCFEGWRPNEVIYGKHIHVCVMLVNVFGPFLSSSFCMIWTVHTSVEPKLSLAQFPLMEVPREWVQFTQQLEAWFV